MGQKKVIKKTEEELLKEGKKLEEAIVKTTVVEKEKAGKTIEKGKIYINATYNNTILTAADEKGNVLAWVSSGSLGFSGPKKATPFAASKLVAAISDKLKKFSFSNIEIIIKGVSGGRDAAPRGGGGARGGGRPRGRGAADRGAGRGAGRGARACVRRDSAGRRPTAPRERVRVPGGVGCGGRGPGVGARGISDSGRGQDPACGARDAREH